MTEPSTEYCQVKSKLHQLTESEKEAFLKWGNYSIQPAQDNDDKTQFIVLDDAGKQFSKNGLKRVIKRYFYSMNRPQIKRAAKKRKRDRKLREKELLDVQIHSEAHPLTRRRLRGRNLRALVQDKLDQNHNPLHIVLDCRFDDLMDYEQLVSVGSQIRQLYGLNMRAPQPCHLYATSFGGRLKAQFRNKNNDDTGLAVDKWKMKFIEESMEEHFDKDQEFVYLSADSEHELECIETDKVYVIGAFVDKNAYKGYTNNLAKEHGWKTAKLPILKYMKVNEKDEAAQKTRLVITINQVLAILVAMYNWNDWRKALQFAFPSRKGLVLKEPLNEREIEQSVFDGHMIPRDSNKYMKRVLDNEQQNHYNYFKSWCVLL
eukprot:186901_1